MAYDMQTVTADCYEGTTCLVNKLNIKDETVLSKIEADITFAKTAEWESNPVRGEWTTDYYKAIHRFLFEDLYDWAGEFRTINISKKGTQFVDCGQLSDLSDKIFHRLKALHYLKGLPFSQFIDELTDIYCSLNLLHPFREGNGRTERVFITQLIRENGYTINFSEMDKDLLMIATIQSAQGVTDNLKAVFSEAVKS